MWCFVCFDVGGGFVNIKVRKYFASCRYVYVYILYPTLHLMSDKTANGSCVANFSIGGVDHVVY